MIESIECTIFRGSHYIEPRLWSLCFLQKTGGQVSVLTVSTAAQSPLIQSF